LNKVNIDYSLFENITILIVEDDQSELEELCELFNVYFKKCHSAVNGKDGLEKFLKYHPDIILTDYGMPLMDGLDMAEKIREIDSEATIVLHTVFTDINTFLKAIKYKISGYVVKPTNVRDLLNILAKESSHILKNRDLKKKNLLMQSILNEFPEPMMVTDLNHNVLFANKKIKNNGFWTKDKPIKCHKALHGFDNFCNNQSHKCDNIEAINVGHSIMRLHEIISKNGNKLYLDIKTIPLKDENNNIYALLKTIQDKTNEKKRELTLQHTINHDVLTGIPNRVLLNDRLNQAILRSNRDKTCFAVMFLDFDGFKKINDKYGHKIGDIVLIQATCRMQKSIRKIDTLARIGGDEFIIILEGISNKNEIKNLTKEILKKLRSNYIINKKIKIKMTSSIGIDIYDPNKMKKSKEELLQNADNSMYEIKKTGKDGFKFNLNALINE